MVLIFPHAEVHLIERAQLLLSMGNLCNHAMTFSFSDGPPCRTGQAGPKRFNIRLQITAVPCSLLTDRKAIIDKRHIIVYAANDHRMLLFQDFVDQTTPLVGVGNKWITII